MKQISLALHLYHDTHGRFPPAVVRDKSGRPLLSWRVLVLPYLESQDLYRQFKLDEPWDSPRNLPLSAHMPEIFAPPPVENLKSEPNTTFYEVFVGKGAAFEGSEGRHLSRDFPDGPARTILVIEAGQAVPWTKPADLDYQPDQSLPSIGGIFTTEGRFSLFGSNRVKGFNAAMVDGSVHFIRAGVPEASLRALITRNGGEKQDVEKNGE